MTQWIAGVTRGHNAGVCLLKDGEIVFATEEERFSRQKYDGGPYAGIYKILEYTDKLDYLVVSHTIPIKDDVHTRVEFTGDHLYEGIARKLGLIERIPVGADYSHPQIKDVGEHHHKMHAAAAFYRSGFNEAVAVVVDGAGSVQGIQSNVFEGPMWELESIYKCEYPCEFRPLYKHFGCNGPITSARESIYIDEGNPVEVLIDDCAGIVKTYEAVTYYCGWPYIEAGKTMGLFPYGEQNDQISPLFIKDVNADWVSSNRNLIIPTYPAGAKVNEHKYKFLSTDSNGVEDLTQLKNRRDLAYAVQTETQQMVLDLLIKAAEMSGCNNVVLSGGYGLNCVANYFYLDELNKRGINLYVEPVSNDAGTAIGAALIYHHELNPDNRRNKPPEIYTGPVYNFTDDQIQSVASKYDGTVREADDKTVVELLRSKNIVTIFQGRSECGPRALGNRSILFDPTFEDGKDFVNNIKHREYFRPFAGSILAEHVHEWFDLKGMSDSPYMMYAVNCRPGVEEKIPSIIHVDGTCRIQTVTEEQNPLYYRLINEFYKVSGVPILFNTSFNLGGEPLVETLDDAVRTLANSDIEYLYLPEHNKLIIVKNNFLRNEEVN